MTIFIFGGGYSELQNRGYSEDFGPKFQPLQQAHASQIVSHILRMWRLISRTHIYANPNKLSPNELNNLNYMYMYVFLRVFLMGTVYL